MYADFFGLRELPFQNTPDPRFFYSTPDHEEALASLVYTVQERKGFVLLTGEVGAGKTLLSRMMIRHFGTRIAFATVNHVVKDVNDLLESICTEFDLPMEQGGSHARLVRSLHDFLLARFARNTPVVLVLDEAQTLPDEAFEQLRTIGNLEADDAKLLQIIIVGQPELQERFASSRLRQLRQRIFRTYHLTALSPEATQGYIQLRLSVAGATDLYLFHDEAIQQIYQQSQGIPRVINTLCDNAMLSAYSADQQRIDGPFMRSVIQQMDNATEARETYADPGPSLRPSRNATTAAFETPADEEERKGSILPRPLQQAVGLLSKRLDDLEAQLFVQPIDPSERTTQESDFFSERSLPFSPLGPWFREERNFRRELRETVRKLGAMERRMSGTNGTAREARSAQTDLKRLVDQARSVIARAEVGCRRLDGREASIRKLADTMATIIKEVRYSFAGIKTVSSKADHTARELRKTYRRAQVEMTRSAGHVDRPAPPAGSAHAVSTPDRDTIGQGDQSPKNRKKSEVTGVPRNRDALADNGFASELGSARDRLSDLRDFMRENNPGKIIERRPAPRASQAKSDTKKPGATDRLAKEVESLLEFVQSTDKTPIPCPA